MDDLQEAYIEGSKLMKFWQKISKKLSFWIRNCNESRIAEGMEKLGIKKRSFSSIFETKLLSETEKYYTFCACRTKFSIQKLCKKI